MTTVLEPPRGDARSRFEPAAVRESRSGIIDCDVHPTARSLDDLKPYLSTRWWRHLQTFGLRPRHGFAQADPYPKAAPRAARRDAWTPDGGKPGSDLAFMREHYLEPYGIERAILSPLYPTGQGDQNSEFSAAMCSAANDWQREIWTRQDARLKASVLVPYEDGEASRAEIERRAGEDDFAQVLMLSRTSEPAGKRRYWPIYEAASAAGLPVAIHVFGYSGYPVSAAGWPSFYIEEMTGHSISCQSVVSSLVLEGVFERFPGLKVLLIEGGFAWLPALAWRLDKHWAVLREEVPHLRRQPSEYIREHCWITTQPMEEPEQRAQVLDVMEWIGWDRLLFATDYPHWDFDDPAYALPPGMDAARRRAIYSENARALFGLPD
jgi:predicted TIM-barrel fold metal-dependent hydrolase